MRYTMNLNQSKPPWRMKGALTGFFRFAPETDRAKRNTTPPGCRRCEKGGCAAGRAMTQEETVITVRLNNEQALVLAQFVKRLTWTKCQNKAVDEEEAYTIRAAVDILQQALQDAGYAPH